MTDPVIRQRAAELRRAHEARAAQLRLVLHGVDLDERDEKLIRWLAGWEAETVERVVSLIDRARRATT